MQKINVPTRRREFFAERETQFEMNGGAEGPCKRTPKGVRLYGVERTQMYVRIGFKLKSV